MTPFVLLAANCAVSTARRKTSVYRSLVDSWLAPLAAPSSVFIRMALAPLLQLVLLLLAIAVPVLAGSLSRASAVTLWSAVCGAYVAGFVVGWLAPHDKSAGAPNFHYAAVRKPRANWAQAPGLEPLSYWAMGQARVSTKPNVTAGALLFVLMALPMGTGGETAIAIAAGAWVVFLPDRAGRFGRADCVIPRGTLAHTDDGAIPSLYGCVGISGRVGAIVDMWVGRVPGFCHNFSRSIALRADADRRVFACSACVTVAVACWFAMRSR